MVLGEITITIKAPYPITGREAAQVVDEIHRLGDELGEMIE